MKLFLSSLVKHETTVKDLKEYLGGFEGKTIAYIPTASNGETEFGDWANRDSWNLVKNSGANITVVQLEDYKDQRVVDIIKGNDIVWFAGGFSTYLMYWIIRCNLDQHIRSILDSGTIYVGSSAGSMICAPSLKVETWYSGEANRTGNFLPGLGLVDFEIFPHYDDSMFSEVQNSFSGKTLYLLKDGESIIYEDGNIKVLGEERIIKR